MKYRFIIILILFYISFSKVFSQNIGIKLPVAALPNTTLDVNGAVSYREGTPLSIVNGTNNNIAVDSMSFYRITAPTAVFTITGFTNGQNGRLLFLINATSYAMTLSHQTGSSAANQINTGEGTDLRIAANGSVTLIYNTTLQKWVVWSKSGEQTDWRLSGNSGTTAGTNFIGTTDGQDFVLKSNNIERARLTNSNGGGLDIAQHLSVGADAGAMTVYQTARIAENYSAIPLETTRNLWLAQTRTEASPTIATAFYGVDAEMTYRMNGDATKGLGAAMRGNMNVDGNYGFNQIIGGDFSASTSANSGTQRSMIGAYGISFNEGTGTIQQASGTYGDVTLSSTGTITEGAGAQGWAFLNGTGNITTAYGFQGGAAKDDGATGTITTGVGGGFTSHNALTNYGLRATAYASLGSTYTNTYGGEFQAYSSHAASIFTNAYGVYSSVYKNSGTITNGYAGYFNAQHGSTTNYGVYSTVGNSATNNYALYGNVTGGGNTDWGLYINGEDKNYFSNLVGIGTTAPEAALHLASNNGSLYNDMIIAGHSDIDDMPVLNIRRSRGTMASPTNLTNGSTIGGIHFYGYTNGGWNYLSAVNAHYQGNGTTNLSNLTFQTSNTERMRIDQNGNIGIGQTNITDRVEIVSESSDDNYDDVSVITYTASTTPSFQLRRAKGSAASPASIGNNENCAGFNTYVHNGASFISATSINATSESDFTTTQGVSLAFGSSRSGSLTEKMRLTSQGSLCIGNTNTATTHKINVTGTAGLSTGTSWTNTSDLRVKENITPYQRGLKEILAINPVFYTYKSNSGLGNGEQNIGIIAQDVEKILPEAIMTAPIALKDSTIIQDGKHLYRADAIWFAMINAFKEQQEMLYKKDGEIKALKEQQEQTRNDLDLLKKQMTQLSSQMEAVVKKQN